MCICYANISPLELFLDELLKRLNFRVGALWTDRAWAAVVAAVSSKLKRDEADEREAIKYSWDRVGKHFYVVHSRALHRTVKNRFTAGKIGFIAGVRQK